MSLREVVACDVAFLVVGEILVLDLAQCVVAIS
jgi:hypothetical protein